MRFVVFKQNVKAVVSWLGIAALALALGIGATSAMLHPGWLNVTQPSVKSSAFAKQPQVEAPLPVISMTVSKPKGVGVWDLIR